jgi:hypothetical protein
MFSLKADWNPKQTALREVLSKPEHFNDAIRLCLELHGLVHSAQTASAKKPNVFDELLDDLTRETFAVKPGPNSTSIAWEHLAYHVNRRHYRQYSDSRRQTGIEQYVA